jgi:hypothetical protein
MKKLFITEEEKNRILNLHKKLIKEDIGCPCKDGTTSEECCEKTNQIKTELTPEQKEEIIIKAELLKKKEDELKNQQIDEEKKLKIETIQKQLDQTYNDILSKPKMDKYQQKVFDDRIKSLQNELNTMKGLPTSQSGDPQKRTTDQKVNAWVSVASSLLAIFSTVMLNFRRPSQ